MQRHNPAKRRGMGSEHAWMVSLRTGSRFHNGKVRMCVFVTGGVHCLECVCLFVCYDRFHRECYTPEIHRIEKLKFRGTNSNQNKISIWICTARYWGIWVCWYGGLWECSFYCGKCHSWSVVPSFRDLLAFLCMRVCVRACVCVCVCMCVCVCVCVCVYLSHVGYVSHTHSLRKQGSDDLQVCISKNIRIQVWKKGSWTLLQVSFHRCSSFFLHMLQRRQYWLTIKRKR